MPERAILIDDGFVSGHTAFAAMQALRARGTKEIVLGVPILFPWVEQLEGRTFDLVYHRMTTMARGTATGMFYWKGGFNDTPDQEVINAIQANHELPGVRAQIAA